MTSMQQSRRHYTLDDYFSLQRGVELKLEYFNGEIYAMAGGSANHNRVSRNVLSIFVAAPSSSPWEAFGSDMRIGTPSGLYTYPDVSIVCGERVNGRAETISNPVVLVEVLSDSTRDYDRGEKYELYRSISTLQHYLLIEPGSVRVEHRWRGTEGIWMSEMKESLEATMHLAQVGIDLPLARVYAGVELT
jgi:Uma2 family endonuclease